MGNETKDTLEENKSAHLDESKRETTNNNNNNKPKTPRAKSKGRNKKKRASSVTAKESDIPTSSATPAKTEATSTATAAGLGKTNTPSVSTGKEEKSAEEIDEKQNTSQTTTERSTTTLQTKEEMEMRMAALLVRKSDDDEEGDSSMTEKEKAGVAWRILQFCLASRIQKVKVHQNTQILQEPPRPEKAKSLQQRFVSKMSATAGEEGTAATPAEEEEAAAEEAAVEEAAREIKEIEREEEVKVEASLAAKTSMASKIETEAVQEKPAEMIVDKQQQQQPQPDGGKKSSKERKSSKSESQSRSRTPSVSLEQKPGANKNKKRSKQSATNNKKPGGGDHDDIDALIADVMKMDAEKASSEIPGSGSSSKKTSRASSKVKEIPSSSAPPAATTPPAAATPPVVSSSSSELRMNSTRVRQDYSEVKTNYDNMFEEFETDILLSMEEMQKMGKTSGQMEDRLNAIQSRSSNQSHRFRAVKESYKALGSDLERRLKTMLDKRKETEKAEEEAEEEEKDTSSYEGQSGTAFSGDELQNALMSSLEGKAPPAAAASKEEEAAMASKSPASLHSPADDEGELTDEKDAELTDKGYTLTDDGVSDDLDVFGALKRKQGVMSASMFASTPMAEDDASASMTTSWGDCLEKNDDNEDDDRQGRENRDEFADQPVVAGYKQRSADGQPALARHRSVAGSCVSEDSGLSDSKTSDPYDPYKGKKKRKQRPRVKSMIEI